MPGGTLLHLAYVHEEPRVGVSSPLVRRRILGKRIIHIPANRETAAMTFPVTFDVVDVSQEVLVVFTRIFQHLHVIHRNGHL